MNLENDIEPKRKRKTADSGERESWQRGRGSERNRSGAERIRIEQKSLILAQDERWRRA